MEGEKRHVNHDMRSSTVMASMARKHFFHKFSLYHHTNSTSVLRFDVT